PKRGKPGRRPSRGRMPNATGHPIELTNVIIPSQIAAQDGQFSNVAAMAKGIGRRCWTIDLAQLYRRGAGGMGGLPQQWRARQMVSTVRGRDATFGAPRTVS